MFIPPASAQVESSGCHPDFRDRIGETASQIDFDAMCDAYIECLSTDNLDCILPVFEVAFFLCEGVDACENEATLYSATIDLFNHPDLAYELTFDNLPIDTTIDALEAIHNEDYESALSIYEHIAVEYQHPMINVSIGYVYAQMGKYELAIESYKKALSQSINEPITYYAITRAYSDSNEIWLVRIYIHILNGLFDQVDSISINFDGFVEEHPLRTLLL